MSWNQVCNYDVSTNPSLFASGAPAAWGQVNNAPLYNFHYAASLMPDYLRNLVHAVVNKLDVDPGMAFSTLLSAMASAVQGVRLVLRPDEGLEPLAYFSIVLAGPTTGKTRTHRLVHAAHNTHDIRRYKSYQQAKRKTGAGDVGSNDDTTLRRVGTGRLRSVIQQDTSNRGLLEAVEGIGESTSISVHEGQKVLGSILFRQHLDTLNMLHDCEGRAMLTRGKGDVVIALNASLNALVMVQPDIFGTYLQKHGKTARGIGFLARCLFTTVPPFRTVIGPSVEVPADCLETFNAKAEAFLDAQLANLEAGDTDREVIKFSPNACQLWRDLIAEHRNLTSERYWHVQDAANRAMQNVARVAGIIHSYCNEEGDISSETLYAAWAIVQWHLGQFAELFPAEPLPMPAPPKATAQQKQLQREFEDGRTIVSCIAEMCQRSREPDALKSRVFIRSALYNARFRTALMRLVDDGLVLESGEGKATRLSIVPQHALPLTNQPMWLASSNGGI